MIIRVKINMKIASLMIRQVQPVNLHKLNKADEMVVT